MKRLLALLLAAWCVALNSACAAPTSTPTSVPSDAASQVAAPADEPAIAVGMTDTTAYFPLLRGRRVAVLANQTAVADMGNGSVHLVDLLHDAGFRVTSIFSPEHGFRGTADAGEHVANGVDSRTGIPIRSLYDGRTNRPSAEAMSSFDVVVVDMQDVGLRFYTYYITMLRMMEAAADAGKEVIVLDRPNPMGHHVDGPVLDMQYKSGVGALPIPVLHGLTMGEIARMAVGEGWCKRCRLRVVRCRNYRHDRRYVLPIAPSPALQSERAIYLYASLCLFEGTPVSVGRGTDHPFECYGHPAYAEGDFAFTPRPTAVVKQPLLSGMVCRGVDLRALSTEEAREVGFSLRYLIDACRHLQVRADNSYVAGERFFTPMFEKLVGVGWLRDMLLSGADESEMRARWQQDLDAYKRLRTNYLLYD